MRDKLVHEYFGINKKVVWRTIKEDIPVLLPKMKEIFQNMAPAKNSSKGLKSPNNL